MGTFSKISLSRPAPAPLQLSNSAQPAPIRLQPMRQSPAMGARAPLLPRAERNREYRFFRPDHSLVDSLYENRAALVFLASILCLAGGGTTLIFTFMNNQNEKTESIMKAPVFLAGSGVALLGLLICLAGTVSFCRRRDESYSSDPRLAAVGFGRPS